MPVTISTSKVNLETLVKRRGEWNKVIMPVPDSVIRGTVVGPFRVVKDTIVQEVVLEFPHGAQMRVPVTASIVRRGAELTITLEI